MAIVLIATLGDSPIVVSGMFNLLSSLGKKPDLVQIMYPSEPNERWIEIGYELLEKNPPLLNQTTVAPISLPFADAYTEEHCRWFLQLLSGVLEQHERVGNVVYLSLAGGRKHISALMALLPQFYPCVKGLYHLHDLHERNPRKQYTIDFLEQHPDRLDQPASRFQLIALPHEQLAQGAVLRQWLARHDQGEEPPPIRISPTAESFYGAIFQQRSTRHASIDIWLTKTAYDQYMVKYRSSPQEVERYFEDMRDPAWLATPDYGIHNHANDTHADHQQQDSRKRLIHYACKKGATGVRPFYYTQPHPITAYPQERIERAVITRFSEKTKGNHLDVELEEWVNRDSLDIEPFCRIVDLPGRQRTPKETVLIAPLGETPMVVTQAYTLLQSAQHIEPALRIQHIHVVYPRNYEPACNAVRVLQQVCEERNIPLNIHPVAEMEDLVPETIESFRRTLQQVICEVRRTMPDADIALLLAGGRKGMSAIAFYIAQVEGITQVYHTTIRDPEKEREVEEITIYEELRYKPPTEQAAWLFLDRYNTADFTLIAVPVIPLISAESRAESPVNL